MISGSIIINNPENYSVSFCIESWTRNVLNELHVRIHHIEITLLSIQAIQALNNQYFQNNCPTDTITFNIDEQIDNQYIEMGDIYLCPDHIKANANRWKVPIDQEFKIVIIHSLLHLIGDVDSTPVSAHKMRQRQANIYAKLTS